VKLVSKKDGSTYEYDPENCRAQAVNAMFGMPTAFLLKQDNTPIFADADGAFRGLKPGETYTVMPQQSDATVPPETAAEMLRERMSEKERSKSPLQVRTELLLAFHRYDSNNSGDIDENEWLRLLAELGTPISEAEAKAAFRKLDTDGNGVIDFQEFYEWYTKPKETGILSRLGTFLSSLLPTLANWGRL